MVIHDSEGGTGEFSARLGYMLTREAYRASNGTLRPVALYVDNDAEFETWGHSGPTRVPMVGGQFVGTPVKLLPPAIQALQEAGVLKLPEGTKCLVMAEYGNGKFIVGAY